MPDNLNTAYLGQSTTADNLNSPILGTASNTTEVEENPKDFSSEVSFGTTVSIGGALASASAASFGAIAGTTVAATSAFSRTGNDGGLVTSTGTSSSANSATLGDGVVGVFESTLTNVTLVYRSGNTTYHWVSSNGSVG